MATSNYRYLNRAQLSINYLHSNSTTHEFLFGALAEMIDNSRDANAKNINIYAEKNTSLRGGYMLCFLDDGCGMSPGEARDIMTFGRSFKKDDILGNDRKMIGQYGNGLKSGSMRIGNDFILFTKSHSQPMTCLLLSRSFHEEEKIDEVIVPSPSFCSNTKKLYYEDDDTKEKAETELSIIYKYSPFKNHESLMRAFDSISSPSGTLVCVYTLKLNSDGQTELDFETDLNDILIKPPSTAGLTDSETIDDNDNTVFIPLGPTSSNKKTTSSVEMERGKGDEYVYETKFNPKSVRKTVQDLVTKSGEPIEKISFRAYLSILYFQNPCQQSTLSSSSSSCNINHMALDPLKEQQDHFNMWLRQGRVLRTHWLQWLYKPMRYTFACNKFKACAEADFKKTEKEAKIAEEMAREAESKASDLRNRNGLCPIEKHKRMELRKAHDQSKSLRQKADILKQSADRKMRSLKDPKSLDLTFGINVYDRSKCGAFVYNQSRLTKMYEPFNNHSLSSIKNNGVVCLIDIPYEILEPTHNKQDFADDKEWKMLRNVINNHYNDYVSDILTHASISTPGTENVKSWSDFWTYYGYDPAHDTALPSNEPKFLTRRAMVIPKYKQCVRCLKYRRIPFQMSTISSGEADSKDNPFNPDCYLNVVSQQDSVEFWECSQNQDKKTNRCEVPEQRIDIPLIKLRKVLPKTTVPPDRLSETKSLRHANQSSIFIDAQREAQLESEPKQKGILNNQAPQILCKNNENDGYNAKVAEIGNLFANNNTHSNGIDGLGGPTDHIGYPDIASLRRPVNLQPTASALSTASINSNSTHHHSSLNKKGSDLASITDSLLKAAGHNEHPPTKKFASSANTKGKRKHKQDPTFSVNSSRVNTNALSGLSLRPHDEKVDKLVHQLRKVFTLFTPPNYHFTCDEVANFNVDKLLEIDVINMKDHFEIELNKLIVKQSKKFVQEMGPQYDLSESKEYQQCRGSLLQLRRNVSSLLNMTSPGINLDPNVETEEVDSFVLTCLSSFPNIENNK